MIMPANDRTVLDFWTKEFGTYVEFKKCSLLEIGCGCGELGLILANGVKQYYGIDPDKENILHARSHAGDKKTITYKVGRRVLNL
jgi:2-polyprenyl-3-methyl-5-hydroxy-6-metoxy-1,4-benzoquinol methylase